MAHIAAKSLQDAWIEVLGRVRWDWFATLTFKDEIHPEAADKRFKKFISMLNRSMHGPRWSRKQEGVLWVKANEFQRRNVLHFHVLLANVGGLSPLPFILRWRELAGFGKIERLRDQRAAMRYITKYVRRGGELDVGGPWPVPSSSKDHVFRFPSSGPRERSWPEESSESPRTSNGRLARSRPPSR